MDSLNKGILEMLSDDARMPFLEIAKSLKVSEGTIRNRVSKLVDHGVIKRFSVELGETGGVSGIVAVKTDAKKSTPAIGASLQKLSKQITRLFEVSGEFDLFCLLECPSVSEMNSLLERIRASKGVVETQTFMVMNKI